MANLFAMRRSDTPNAALRSRKSLPRSNTAAIPAVLRAIAKTGYQGWITVELYPYIDDPDAAGREAKRFLENAG